MLSQLSPPSGYGYTSWTLSGHYFELPVTLCTSIEAEPLLDFSSRSFIFLCDFTYKSGICVCAVTSESLPEWSGIKRSSHSWKNTTSVQQRSILRPSVLNKRFCCFRGNLRAQQEEREERKEQSLKSPENKDKRRKKKQ